MKYKEGRSPYLWPTIMLLAGLILPTILYVILTTECDYIGMSSKYELSEKIYFSIVTFSTLGYGDISPIGWVKYLAALQAISGPITVGFFIYGYGRYQQRVERRKNDEELKQLRENSEQEKFDRMQYYRGDAYQTYSHLLNSFHLECTCLFEQQHVCFLHSKSQTFNSVKTHYYDFSRTNRLVNSRVRKLKNDYSSGKSTRPVFRAQILVDYHIAAIQSLIIRGSENMEIESQLSQRLAAEIRDGHALVAKAKIIKESEKYGDSVDYKVLYYFESLGCYLEHVVYSMKSLAIAPSVYITKEPCSLSATLEDRKKYPDYYRVTSQEKLNMREWRAWG